MPAPMTSHLSRILAAAVAVLAIATSPAKAEPSVSTDSAAQTKSQLNTVSPSQGTAEGKTAFLGFRFIQGATPMLPEEEARLHKIEDTLKSKLEESGKYSFVPVPDDMKSKIVAGQPAGECGGCEMQFAKDLGAGQVAWGTVQKVSDLILNINVYMADVASNKMTFVKSVDIRGNTDETWDQGINYMVKHYILKDAKAAHIKQP